MDEQHLFAGGVVYLFWSYNKTCYSNNGRSNKFFWRSASAIGYYDTVKRGNFGQAR